jgi:hypothetical protein
VLLLFALLRHSRVTKRRFPLSVAQKQEAPSMHPCFLASVAQEPDPTVTRPRTDNDPAP